MPESDIPTHADNGDIHVDVPAGMPTSLVKETLLIIADNINDGTETGRDHYTTN